MKKDMPKSRKTPDLRNKAEQKLRKQKERSVTDLSAEKIQSIVHELQVHQIELEMQNDELRNVVMELEESRTKYSDLYDFAPIGYFTFNRDALITEVNLAGARMLQVERISLINMPFSRFIHKDDKNAFYTCHNSIMKTLSRHDIEIRLIKKDGSIFYAHIECLPVKGSAGDTTLLRSAVMDITDRKRAEKETAEMAKFPSENPFPVMRVTNDGTVIFANTSSQSLLRKWNCEVGKTLPEDIQLLLVNSTVTGLKKRIEVENEGLFISFSVVPVPEAGYINLYGSDITESKKMEKQLQSLSISDDLTGLLNRRGFYTLSEQQCKLADRTGRLLSLLYMDMNNMKDINDELGHKTGDQALIDTANILNKTFRKSDIIARIGGDEFAVLLVEHSEGVNNIITDHLDENIRIHNEQAGRSYKLSLSVGIAKYDPEHSCSVEDLLTLADKLMYKDKKLRKLEALFEQPFQEQRIYERLKMENVGPLLLDGSNDVGIIDISLGGLCLKTSHQLIPGKHHFLNDISDGNEKISAKCLVMWSKPIQTATGKKELPVYEAGLKFSALNKSEQRSLKSIISHLSPL